ncbi:hypothetical protein Bca52824_041226 [Brassica carinata]|uniref:Uncharacterized protein n=1 Tax=Brassica carinata TaxID=52824 RepID=A0A8X7UXK3_BRACI|nr:hypothetical protein Bca52824_041226 [Brassica carinata]
MGVILISTGPSALELYFCLIRFWEAGTGSKGGALIGLELSTNRLNYNPEIAKEVNALEEVTKAGSVTIGKNICLYQARIGQGGFLECVVTIDDHWYLDKIPVYDNNDQAVFVLLGDAGRELTGKHASGLVDKYFEANGDLGPDHEMPACPTSFDRHHWSNT